MMECAGFALNELFLTLEVDRMMIAAEEAELVTHCKFERMPANVKVWYDSHIQRPAANLPCCLGR